MNKLKTKLIHWLGGYTLDESTQSDANAWAIGKLSTLHGIKTYMESIYGLPADEWCDHMYKYIDSRIEQLQHSVSFSKSMFREIDELLKLLKKDTPCEQS